MPIKSDYNLTQMMDEKHRGAAQADAEKEAELTLMRAIGMYDKILNLSYCEVTELSKLAYEARSVAFDRVVAALRGYINIFSRS